MSKVLILMSTYNGEKYLREQLDSIINQSFSPIDILVRDDGSNDGTIHILEEYSVKKLLQWYTGENLRPAKSFMNLVNNCQNTYDYYAFCDQDDFWKNNKIEEAVSKLSDKTVPALYYCATDNVDSDLQHIDYFMRNANASSSLYSSIKTGSLIPGCTMVFNRKLLDVLRLYFPTYIGMHDNWVHLVCLAVHGIVVADENANILYRQHINNAVGSAKKSFKFRFERFFGNPHIYSRIAQELYKGYAQYMSPTESGFMEQNIHYQKRLRNTMMCLMDRSWSGISYKEIIMYKIKIICRVF